jgi:hypothetical protein
VRVSLWVYLLVKYNVTPLLKSNYSEHPITEQVLLFNCQKSWYIQIPDHSIFRTCFRSSQSHTFLFKNWQILTLKWSSLVYFLHISIAVQISNCDLKLRPFSNERFKQKEKIMWKMVQLSEISPIGFLIGKSKMANLWKLNQIFFR